MAGALLFSAKLDAEAGDLLPHPGPVGNLYVGPKTKSRLWAPREHRN
jgi:hypothetical protein